MANTYGKQKAIIEKIRTRPYDYEFYQLIRLIEYFVKKNLFLSELIDNHVKISEHNKENLIIFSTSSELGFPSVPTTMKEFIINIEDVNVKIPHLVVPFIGLTGIKGALPSYYTEKVLDCIYNDNSALKDFFDIFNHRIICLLYDAWKRNNCYVNYSRVNKSFAGKDQFGYALSSLSGVAYDLVYSNLKVEKEIFAYYVQMFNRNAKSLMGLECILNEYFDLRIKIIPCCGQWLYLEDNFSLLSGAGKKYSFNQVGQDFILGKRQWTVQNKFRIYIGPLNYSQFKQFGSKMDVITKLVKIVRSYVSTELNFDVQLELNAKEVPYLEINTNKELMLGRNTWLLSKKPNANISDNIISFEV